MSQRDPGEASPLEAGPADRDVTLCAAAPSR